MSLKLYEADRPRTLSSKVAEYVQKPAWPSLRFLKDQIEIIDIPDGKRIDFALRSGLPVPLIYTIHVEAKGLEDGPVADRAYDYDHIGPLSTDDWSLEIKGWIPRVVVLKVGLEPFEIETDSVELVLARPSAEVWRRGGDMRLATERG